MKGFKNTTRTQYITGSEGHPKGAAKVAKVMGNFKKPMKKAEGGAVTEREMAKMRADSPKGGALGKMTEREMRSVKRKGVPTHSSTPMIKKAYGGKVKSC